MPLTEAAFAADTAAVILDRGKVSFGSGRLIAPGLVLTAHHVVDVPAGAPYESGWRVRLARERIRGQWRSKDAYEATVAWPARSPGDGAPDLALLKIQGCAPEPSVPLFFASYDLHAPLEAADAVGFPEARWDPLSNVCDYSVRGTLVNASAYGLFDWMVPLQASPDNPEKWKGMSGAVVCHEGPQDQLYLLGCVEEVPRNFHRKLSVARLSDAFADPEFVAVLAAALGEAPHLVPAPRTGISTVAAPRATPPLRHSSHAFPELTKGIETRGGSASVEKFVEFYVGTRTHRSPLVGRAAQLDALSTWLEQPAAPYALIMEPAGRGKSALVTRWAHDIAVSNRAQVALLPISQRFNTASALSALEILGQRLRYLHSDQSATPADASEWARDIEDHFRRPTTGMPLLVVIDGLDEAGGWTRHEELRFPSEPGQGVKVVVTTRKLADRDKPGLLRQLGWQGQVVQIRLPPLRRTDLRDAILNWVPPLPDGIDATAAVERLWPLTEKGDPLLTTLYLNGLAAHDISIDRLPTAMPPGLEGLFGEWIEDWTSSSSEDPLDRPAVIKTASALCCSEGPIGLRDLGAVLKDEVPARQVEKAIGALHRFVTTVPLGQGDGYVFQHPRLGMFFHRYVDSDRAWHGRYAAIGKEQIERLARGELHPAEVSPYFLQHLGHHLEHAAGDLGALALLASQAWLEAWRASDSTEWGFLSDIDRVARIAVLTNRQTIKESGQAAFIGCEATSAFARASLVSLSRAMPPEVLAALLDRGVWNIEHALVEARQAPRPMERALGLIVIAQRLDRPDSADLLDEAMGMASSLDAGDRVIVLKALCATAIALGDLDRAMLTQPEVADDAWRTEILTTHANRLISVMDRDGLMTSIEGLDAEHLVDVLVSWALCADGELGAFLVQRAQSAAAASYPDKEAVALLRLASAPTADQVNLVDRALDIADKVSEWGMADDYCRTIFAALPSPLTPSQHGRCLAIVERIAQRHRSSGPVLAELVRHYPKALRHAARRQVLSTILEEGSLPESDSRNAFVPWIGDIYDDEIPDLLESLRQRDVLTYAPITLGLAHRISDAEFEARAHEALVALLAKEHSHRYYANELAPYIPPARWHQVLQIFERICRDDELPLIKSGAISASGVKRVPMTGQDKREALCEVIQAAVQQLPDECLAAAADFACSVQRADVRCATLSALLPRATGALQDSIVRDALDAAPGVWSTTLYVELFEALPTGLPVRAQLEAVELLHRTAGSDRLSALTALAPKLDAEPLLRLHQLTRRIHDGYLQAKLMAAFAPVANRAAIAQWVRTLILAGRHREAVSAAPYVRPEDIPELLRLEQTFDYPPYRADYLAALAPQLAQSQISEVLQRMSSLGPALRRHPGPRRCLHLVARRCAELGLVDDALQAIEQWPLDWEAAEALWAISGLLPSEAAGRIEQMARRLSRSAALCALAPLTQEPASLRAELLRAAEQDSSIYLKVLAADWRDEFDMRAVWLDALANFDQLRWKWDDVDRALTRSHAPVRRLAVTKLLDWCESDPSRMDEQRLLAVLARHCADMQFMRLAQLVRPMRNFHDWMRVAGPLLEHAPDALRGRLAGSVRYTRDYPKSNNYPSDFLTDILTARFSTDAERRDVIDTALRAVAQGETWLLRYVTPLLMQESVEDAYGCTSDVMRELSASGRETLLKALADLAPVIRLVARAQGPTDVVDAMREVCEWWP